MGTGTHHHDTAFSIVKALGIVAVVISHAAILTPLETFTYYFNTAVFFFVAGYFFDDGQTATPGRFIGRKLRRLYLPYVVLGTLFVLLHNRFLEWHLIAYDFSAREAILPYDTPELLRTLGRVFLFLHHEQMLAPFWFLQGLFLGLMLFSASRWRPGNSHRRRPGRSGCAGAPSCSCLRWPCCSPVIRRAFRASGSPSGHSPLQG